MAKEALFHSSIGKKFAMALSAMFLVVFLVLHLVLNSLSVFCPAAYDSASLFMGYNPIIQFIMQPILAFAVVYHFVMGIVLETQNRRARPIKYAYNRPQDNTTWMSRNMIWSGLTILAFFVLHFIDFWFPEMAIKIQDGYQVMNETRFYDELLLKFSNPIRVGAYVIAFILLMMHLLHGFQSAFQSVGFNNKKYTPFIKAFGKWFAIIVPVGFILIAVINYLKTI